MKNEKNSLFFFCLKRSHLKRQTKKCPIKNSLDFSLKNQIKQNENEKIDVLVFFSMKIFVRKNNSFDIDLISKEFQSSR